MQKESIIIFGLSLLISAVIVGALSYAHYKSSLNPNTSQTEARTTTKPRASSVSTPVRQPLANTQQHAKKAQAPKRLIYPQKCIDANGKITITDQPDCANAAPANNLSIVESVSPPPRQKKPQNQSKSRTSKTTDNTLAKKPSLQLFGVTPPRDTPRECKFPVGKALEIERSLSVAKDPAKSIWKKSYCRWIKEARQDGCEISRKYFYYSHLCF